MTLKDARTEADLTQTELAAKAGIDQVTVSEIERGKIRQPSYETVVKVVTALNHFRAQRDLREITAEELFPVDIEEAPQELRS